MDVTAAARAAALWAGLHVLLLLVLAVLVTRQRRKHKVALGDGGVPALQQAIRAFGNATEYVPTGLIALTVLALAGGPALLVHLIGLILFAGRLLHGLALSRSGGATRARVAGMVATWTAYVAAAAALIFFAIP